MNRHGFTLIEIMLVIALMAILTGAAALKLTETLRSATLDETCQRLVELDNLARSRASNGGTPTQLEFRLEAGKVFYHDATDSTGSGSGHVGAIQVVERRNARCLEKRSGGNDRLLGSWIHAKLLLGAVRSVGTEQVDLLYRVGRPSDGV